MNDRNNERPLTEASSRRMMLKAAAGVGAGAVALAAGMADAAAAAPNITIYHIEERRSERVVWLMEELGWSYDLVFKPGDLMGSMALAKAVHPMGMVPTVKINDVIMVESGAILEYIITKYAGGRLWVPTDSPDYPLHLLWMHYAEGSAANRIVDDYMAHTIPAGTPTPMTRIFMGDAGRVLAMVERHLDAYPYFGGQTFTAADIMMYFPMHLTRNWGVDWSLYPRLGPWFDQMENRAAFKRMRARALPNGPLPSAGPLAAKLLADTGKS